MARPPGWGTVLAMCLLAHGPIGRRRPLIPALPFGPRRADHLALGAIAGAVSRARG